MIESDPVMNAVIAVLPRRELSKIARHPDVHAIEAAPAERRLASSGLGLSTDVVGAPAFWAAGFTGGTGVNDPSPVDLAIASDKSQHDHPAFAGIDFQTPSNVTYRQRPRDRSHEPGD